MLQRLPRSAVRSAMSACHSGEESAALHWENMCRNLDKGTGGRFGKELMRPALFHELFPRGFFAADPETGIRRTALGDFLELEHLLPSSGGDRNEMLERLAEVENEA